MLGCRLADVLRGRRFCLRLLPENVNGTRVRAGPKPQNYKFDSAPDSMIQPHILYILGHAGKRRECHLPDPFRLGASEEHFPGI